RGRWARANGRCSRPRRAASWPHGRAAREHGSARMRILITGGAGFIGSHVTDAYLAAGHDVAVVDDLSSGSADNVHPRARWYRIDIRDPALDSAFTEERPEIVCHH